MTRVNILTQLLPLSGYPQLPFFHVFSFLKKRRHNIQYVLLVTLVCLPTLISVHIVVSSVCFCIFHQEQTHETEKKSEA